MFSFTFFAPFLVCFAVQLQYAKVDTSSASYNAVNIVAHFGKEMIAEYTLEDYYIVSTIQERKLYRCARYCMKNKRCNFVNYIRRFQLCIFVGSELENPNWEKEVAENPGSVLLVKTELLRHGWKNKDKSEDCGPHSEPEHGEFLGNMFTPGSKTIHTCETQPGKYFITYECTSGVWSVVPEGGLTEPCCEQWKLNQSCYTFDTDDLKTMHEADTQCRASGGYLIHIETIEEQNFISNMMEYVNRANERIVWIGLSDEEIEGTYKWLGETTKTNFTHFARNQPTGNPLENCGVLWPGDEYRWHDAPCSFRWAYICEYELLN